MKLIMQNTCANELPSGCEYTVVEVDAELARLIAARTQMLHRSQQHDQSLWQFRYWDWRPQCINDCEELDTHVPSGCEMAFAEWIEAQDSWVLLHDIALPDSALVRSDCQMMTLTLNGDTPEVGWVYHLHSGPEVIRTAGVDLRKLCDGLDEPITGDLAVALAVFSSGQPVSI